MFLHIAEISRVVYLYSKEQRKCVNTCSLTKQRLASMPLFQSSTDIEIAIISLLLDIISFVAETEISCHLVNMYQRNFIPN